MKLALAFLLLTAVFGAVAMQQPFFSESTLTDSEFNAGKARWSYTLCGWPEDIARIEFIEISPGWPEAGKNATITAKVKIFEDIQEGAYVDVQLKKGHMTPEIYSYDLCELGRESQERFSCPIRAGNHTFIRTVTLPKNILPVVYSIFTGAYTVDGSPIFCPHVHIDFRPPKLSEDD